MLNRCGDCSLCCKLADVPEIGKKSNSLCQHYLAGKGCQIYDTRPLPCENFNCFWLAESWPYELRPDICSVMFEALPGVTTVLAQVYPYRGMRHKDMVEKVIRKLLARNRIVIMRYSPSEDFYFLPPGKRKEDALTDIQEVLKNNGCSVLYN